MSEPALGLYGYAPELAFLRGLEPDARADCLAGLGATVVFGGDDDPTLAEALRARGIRVMAEFGCFVGRDWWERYPDSQPLLSDGALLVQDGFYCGVNPAHQGVRDALLRRLMALVQSRPLDGLWLDFCRWPCHWEAPAPPLPDTSFDAATVAAFGRDAALGMSGEGATAACLLLGELREAWLAWRCSVVTQFAVEAAAIVRTAQPHCLVGMFSVPWRRDDWDGALTRIVGQDLAALSPHIDVFSPMVYHRMCGQAPGWVASVCEDARLATSRPVWPIVQSVDQPPGMSPLEYRAALQAGLRAGDGVLVFNLQGLADDQRRAATADVFGGRSGCA